MKKVEVTIRGYKGLKRDAFTSVDEIVEQMKAEHIVQSMNAYLGAHPFNSAFEAKLVDAAEKAGHKMKTEKSAKGNDVIVETNAEFLKRTEFTVSGAEAQAIVDSLPWPPEPGERKDRVDAYTKVATDRVEKALQGGKTLADIADKLESKGFAVELPDDSDEAKGAIIARFAEYLRSDDI